MRNRDTYGESTTSTTPTIKHTDNGNDNDNDNGNLIKWNILDLNRVHTHIIEYIVERN